MTTDTFRLRQPKLLALGACALLGAGGCGWHGVNAYPLPGAPGHERGSTVLHVEMADVGTLVSNSPVMINDIVIGSVGDISMKDWHADVEVRLQPGVVVPANSIAAIGQTSLLGSSHLALTTPPGAAPEGQLAPGSTIPLSATSTYPSTEQTLAALSMVVNGGGLGQIGDIIHSLDQTFTGRTDQIGSLLTRLNDLMTALDSQRDNIVTTIGGLNRLAGTFATQRDVLSTALQKLPDALDTLLKVRPDLQTALDKLKTFSDVSTGVINDVQGDLVTDLQNLEPTLQSLATVGPELGDALNYATTYPYGQWGIDHALKGDYANLMATVDLTVPRLRRELLLGTPWGDPNAVVQAAVGDPGYATQTHDPLSAPITPSPPPPAPDTSAPDPLAPGPSTPAPAPDSSGGN